MKVCERCGSSRIFELIGSNPNSKEIIIPLDPSYDCQACDKTLQGLPMDRDEYLREQAAGRGDYLRANSKPGEA